MANVYNVAKSGILDATIDMDADTFEVLLLKSSPVPAFDSDQTTVTGVLGQAANTELTDASYTANGTSGRVVLGTVTVAVDQANDRGEADAPDTTYTALDNETIGAVVLYKRVGAAGPSGDGSHIPIAFYDVADQVTNGGNIVIQWNSEGFLHLT